MKPLFAISAALVAATLLAAAKPAPAPSAQGPAADDGAPWGANVANSPIMGVSYWAASPDSYPQLKSFPPLVVFLVGVEKWSDGTAAPSMGM